jgi:uncharacterized protein
VGRTTGFLTADRKSPVNSPPLSASAVLIIQVKVKPNARASTLELCADGTYLARLKAAPVEGKANAELIALLAHHFDVRKSAVTIKNLSR